MRARTVQVEQFASERCNLLRQNPSAPSWAAVPAWPSRALCETASIDRGSPPRPVSAYRPADFLQTASEMPSLTRQPTQTHFAKFHPPNFLRPPKPKGSHHARSISRKKSQSASDCLWKQPSMAFFHECEPQKSEGFSGFAVAASSGESLYPRAAS